MISTKNLTRLARKWHKMAAIGRERISFPRTSKDVVADGCNKSSLADKGHVVIYTIDQRRLVMPLVYLGNNIFLELFKMSEEEFGLYSDGHITLPCDAAFMDYIMLLIQRGAHRNLEKALLNISPCLLSASLHQGHPGQQSLVCGY